MSGSAQFSTIYHFMFLTAVSMFNDDSVTCDTAATDCASFIIYSVDFN